MSRKKAKSRARKPAREVPKPARRDNPLTLLLSALSGALLTFVVWLVFLSEDAPGTTSPNVSADLRGKVLNVTRKAKSLDDLLKMTSEQLAKVDIAEMNLLCATGLPGAEKLDIDHCLARLDQWAVRVKFETDRHLYRAHDPRYAKHYKHSESNLRATMLVQVLQEDCGVHYNMARILDVDFTNSKDLFLHGIIDDDNGGTCVSMPVLCVAVGRQLGYPMKLVLAKGHVFVRWESADGKERFNIEATSSGGIDRLTDDYYKTWPLEMTPAEVASGRFLKSLSPTEGLACFLSSRGHCLLDNGRTKEAFDTYAAAHRLAPKDPAYLAWTRQAQRRLRPPSFARGGPRGFHKPPMIYRHGPFRSVEDINAYNRRKMKRRMRPPRASRPQSPHAPRPHGPPTRRQRQR